MRVKVIWKWKSIVFFWGRQDSDEITYINTTPANLQASVVTVFGANVQDAIAKYIHRHQPAQK